MYWSLSHCCRNVLSIIIGFFLASTASATADAHIQTTYLCLQHHLLIISTLLFKNTAQRWCRNVSEENFRVFSPTKMHQLLPVWQVDSSKVKYTGITVRSVTLLYHYGNSHAIWDHAYIPAIRQRWHSRRNPSRNWYSITRPWRDARLSWLSCLVTYEDGIPARRRSPIQVLTGPDVG